MLWKAVSLSEALGEDQLATQSSWTLGSPKVVTVSNKAKSKCLINVRFRI